MDPASTMHPQKDTSFALMRAARERGHSCFHCLPIHVDSTAEELVAWAAPIEVDDDAPHHRLGTPERLDLAEVDAVLVRKDPPFDSAYLHLTQQLDALEGKTLIVNAPRGLRDANEKLFATRFPDLTPRTLVSASPERLLAFAKEVGDAILKPLDGAGGAGVVALRAGDRNSRALVDLLTREGREHALVQEFLPGITGGDKRVLLLDGEPLGAIRRVPRSDDIRANIHVGGRVEATTLTRREEEIARIVGEQARARGLYFVGLDLIEERLIEVNVTSPTGIQELARLTGERPDLAVVDWLASRAA